MFMFSTSYYIRTSYCSVSQHLNTYQNLTAKKLASEYLKKKAPCAARVCMLYAIRCACIPNLHTFYSPIKMRREKKLIQFHTSTLMPKEKLLKRKRTRDMGRMREHQWLRGKIVSAEMKKKALLSTARYYRIAAVFSFKVLHTRAQCLNCFFLFGR